MPADPTPWDLAMEAIGDHGCDCDADTEDHLALHTCLAGRCEYALVTTAAERDKALAEVERLQTQAQAIELALGAGEHLVDRSGAEPRWRTLPEAVAVVVGDVERLRLDALDTVRIRAEHALLVRFAGQPRTCGQCGAAVMKGYCCTECGSDPTEKVR